MRARWFADFFFFSSFGSLLYEVIWVRLGMAHFGVTTPVVWPGATAEEQLEPCWCGSSR